VLNQLYAGIPLPLHAITEKHVSKTERNAEICQRYSQGETLEDIAEDFGLSHQRVHQII
jgi:DNA-binding CsgD family transcriptional regulator